MTWTPDQPLLSTASEQDIVTRELWLRSQAVGSPKPTRWLTVTREYAEARVAAHQRESGASGVTPTLAEVLPHTVTIKRIDDAVRLLEHHAPASDEETDAVVMLSDLRRLIETNGEHPQYLDHPRIRLSPPLSERAATVDAIKSPAAELIEAITDLSYKVERSTARDGQGLDGRRTIVQLSLAHAKSILSAVAQRLMCTRCGLRPRWHRAWDVNGETRREETPYCSVCWGDPKGNLSERAEPPANQTMREWVIERWEAEVGQRPLANMHRRTLDGTWRQVYRWLTDEELPRLSHDDALSADKVTPTPERKGASPVLAAQGAEPPQEGK